VCLAIFVLAFTVRTLTWQDNQRDTWRVQTSVTERYKESARQLVSNDFKTFISDVSRLGHPPGYPLVLAAIFKTVGESDSAVQLFQIVVDSIASVVLFLIALELLTLQVALLSGFFAAVSPQFAYFSILLLPDSLIVLPILLAVFLIARVRNHFSLLHLVVAGAFIGLSCWFRANALLLPIILAFTAALITSRGNRLPAAAAVIAGTILLIAPITIKNAIVFHRFIPLSLGSGQTLLEGLADYDPKGTLDIPATDLGLMRQEAALYGKPEYASELFGKDGVERDRMRTSRALDVIRSHPLWFGGVMAKRALASTRLDPVAILKPEYPVTHQLDASNANSVWDKSPRELQNTSKGATIQAVDSNWTRIVGDAEKYGTRLASESISVEPYHDYVLNLPFKLEAGRSIIKITTDDGSKTLSSMNLIAAEELSPSDQPISQLVIPFVSANTSKVRLLITNNASTNPSFMIGHARLSNLGPSSYVWLRYLRMPLRIFQRLFTTAGTLPFVVIGIVSLVCRRRLQQLAILMSVPAYYLLVQSALHTERRYVYVIHYFFIVLVGVSSCWLVSLASGWIRRIKNRS